MFKKLIYFFLLAISLISINLEAKKKEKYKYELALCAIFQNDAPFLVEWIEFHKLVGVQHFYLYNNYSTDNYKEVLAPYVKQGLVEVIYWPYPNENIRLFGKTQIDAYNAGIKRAKDKAKWLIFIDTDEFLFPTVASKIQDELRNYENFGGVAVNWLMFGTSGIAQVPGNKFQIEALTWRAVDDYRFNHNCKSIVRPDRVNKCLNPHCFSYKNNYFCVNTAGQTYNKITADTVVIDKLRINHYWTRDEDYFINYKIPRHEKWGEPIHTSLEIMYNLHQVEDLTIQRFVPFLHDRLK